MLILNSIVQNLKFLVSVNFCLLTFVFCLCSCGNSSQDSGTENTQNDSLKTEIVIPKGEIKIIEPVIDEEIVVIQKGGITLTEIKSDNNKAATITLNTKKFRGFIYVICIGFIFKKNY